MFFNSIKLELKQSLKHAVDCSVYLNVRSVALESVQA